MTWTLSAAGGALGAAGATVRAVPGNEHFLRPPDVGRLQRAAAGGVVVTVNVSRYRCDALLLSSGGLDVLPLPGVTRAAVAAAEQVVAATTGDASDGDRKLGAVLGWLWEVIVGPVLRHLSHRSGGPVVRRLCWMPTGPLVQLPLHATGLQPGLSAADRALRDGWVCSYATTARSLARSAERSVRSDGASGQALLIAVGANAGAQGSDLTAVLRGGRCRRRRAARRDAASRRSMSTPPARPCCRHCPTARGHTWRATR